MNVRVDSLPEQELKNNGMLEVDLIFNNNNTEGKCTLFYGTEDNKIMYSGNIPVPSGFTKEEKDNNVYITDASNRKYKWIWYNLTSNYSHEIYDSTREHKGFYVSVTPSYNSIREATSNLYADRNDIFTYISFKPSNFGATLSKPDYHLNKMNSDSEAHYYTALYVK